MVGGSVWLWVISDVEPIVALLGLLILWVTALPGLLYLQGIDHSPIPFFSLVAIFYAVFFGLPIFLTSYLPTRNGKMILYNNIVIENIDPNILLMVLCGILVMVITYFCMKSWPLYNLNKFRLDSSDRANTLNIMFWLLVLIHFLYEFVPVINAIPSIGQFSKPVIYLAFGGLFLQWRAGRLPQFQLYLFIFAAIPLELFLRLFSFLITPLLLLILFIALVFWRERLKKANLALFGISLLIISSYDITSALRSQIVENFEIPGIERSKIPGVLFNAIKEVTIKGGKKVIMEDSREFIFYYGRGKPIVHRTSQIWVLHTVYSRTPVEIPYWDGETYLPLLTSLIPRIIYSDKPLEQTGYKFGNRYGFLNIGNVERTSVNLPWITEFYANFGIWGLMIGMSLVGIFMAFLDRVFNAQNMNDLEFVFGTTLIFPLIYQESNLSVMTGSMLPLFIILYLYFRLGIPLLDKLQTH